MLLSQLVPSPSQLVPLATNSRYLYQAQARVYEESGGGAGGAGVALPGLRWNGISQPKTVQF